MQAANVRRSKRFFLNACPAVAGLMVALGGCAWQGGSQHPPPNEARCSASDAEVACTAQGAVRGAREGATLAFKGIPYAQPPIGPLRWRPPAPPLPWQGVRDGSSFSAVCPQIEGQGVVGDEDCLTLNVWRPLVPPSEPLPVMVFFTGGGNHSFSGRGSSGFGGVNYNGELLAPQGVVYVSFNYRLGALGFLAHPALDAQSPAKVSGNYGSLDQIAMLRWVQRNIAAFGGDPKRVMLFGTSAGGGNICALMAAPAARGLFHGAAMASSVPTGCELPMLADVQEGTGRRVAQELGCDQGNTAACLRSKTTQEVVRAVPGTFGVLPRIYGPNVDGHVFPEQPLATIRKGAHSRMPVIIGNSTQETMLFVNGLGPVTDAASYEAAVRRVFGAASARVLAAYPAALYASPKQALVQLTTDAFFTCQSRRVARVLSAAQREPVYRYLFAHTLKSDPEQLALGAVHTIEHVFFFPWQGQYRPDDSDLALQRQMVGYWTRLARGDRLDQAAPVAWLPTQPSDRYLHLVAAPSMKTGDSSAQCDFWDTVTLPWPHL